MATPPIALIIPFVLLLGAMALGPVLAPVWWSKHYPKVALGLGAITAGAYLFYLHDAASLGHAAHEYASFIALVGSLFVVAGGIRIQVPGQASPLENVLFLLAGAIAANVLGTTGAAMLLIRPWMQMNQGRVRAYHIAFFIFLVANVGGCLTPIGDPPLFLGYLQGIPFWWVAQNCWPMWATGTGLLLAIFFVVDSVNRGRLEYRQGAAMNPLAPPERRKGGPATAHEAPPDLLEKQSASSPRPPSPWGEERENDPRDLMVSNGHWKVEGQNNVIFLAIILGAVFVERPVFLREAIMLAAAAGSYFTTRKAVHAANEFNFHPVTEVAVLFAGVFATMVPALAWLDHGGDRLLGDHPGPGIFYWSAGGLSAVLDNAPTYLGFLSALFGVSGAPHIDVLLAQKTGHLLAISIGAVFFGAATYIGNGPNFMVKSIAEQRGLRMPSFVEFVVKYSLPFLLPVLATVWLLFFRG